MSIANEINRLQTSKADTKEQVNIDKDYINAGIDFIGSETVDDYDEKIQEMQEAYKAFIPVNTTSDTQIEAPKGGVIIGKTIKGNTTQNGTPTPSSPVPVNNVTGEQIIGTYKHNFLSLKDNIEWRADNTITKTIIDDDNITISYSGENATYKKLCQDNNLQIPNGHYDISCIATCTDNNVEVGMGIDVFPLGSTTRSDWYEIWFTQNAREQGVRVHKDFEIDNSQYYYRIRFFLSKNTGTTSNSVQFKDMMLKEYGDETEYEIYQGKKYEINLGKSIYEGSSDLYGNIKEYSQFTREDLGENVLKLTKTTSGSTSPRFFVSLVQGKTYSVQLKAKGNCTKIEVGMWVDNTQTIQANIVPNENNFTTMSFTFTYSGSNPRIYIRNNDTNIPLNTYIIIKDFMIEEGSQVTSYAPYFEPIELNKIGDYQDYIRKGTGKNICNNADIEAGFPSALGSQIGIIPSANSITYKKCCYVEKSKTYTLSWKRNTPKAEASRDIKIVDESNSVLESIAYSNASSIRAKTFTPNNSGYIYVAVDTNATEVQIEENSNVTYYEPYGYKDKWYIEKNVGKVVLDGSRNWIKSGNTNIDRFVLSDYVDYGDTNCFSNYFDNGIYSDTNYTKNQIFLNTYSSIKRIIINYSTVGTTTLAQFKTWLQSNNTKVYYVLATPTYTLIENEELLNQLDRIMQLYEGQNNILVTGDLAATLDLDYIAKAENHL